ncbi:venom allergen 3-like [Montipora capricornis]|uniref:venom allergen 3-like n=1 Tax=Montipora capricornis TaxID=246305 RepID=UPI0035F1BC62
MWCYVFFFAIGTSIVQAGDGPTGNNKEADESIGIFASGPGTITKNGTVTLNLRLDGILQALARLKGSRFFGPRGRRLRGPGRPGSPSRLRRPNERLPGPGSQFPTQPTQTPATVQTRTTGQTPTTGPTSTAGQPIKTNVTDEQMGLDKHNEFRRVHGVPSMTLDREMCDEAKAYAGRLAAQGTLKHASREERKGRGENLYYSCSSEDPGTTEDAVEAWYSEVCEPGYYFDRESNSGGTLHFTQLVWKESTKLGIGLAESTKDGMKCAYVVARYEPAGNMMGDFLENVPKGNFDRASYCQAVRSKRRRYFDQSGTAVYIHTPFSEVVNEKKKKGFVSSSIL